MSQGGHLPIFFFDIYLVEYSFEMEIRLFQDPHRNEKIWISFLNLNNLTIHLQVLVSLPARHTICGYTLSPCLLSDQGGDLPKIPGGTAIAYEVENTIKSPKNP